MSELLSTTGYGLWLLLAAVALFSILISLPGGWIALAVTVAYDAFHGFDRIGWLALGGFAALLALGELIESVLGTVYVAKKGATRYGMAGAFAGGILGAIVGSSAMPVVGTLFGGFVGAFAGAVALEYWRDRRMQPSLQIGLHATVGRFLAMAVKFSLAIAGLVWCATRAWPSG